MLIKPSMRKLASSPPSVLSVYDERVKLSSALQQRTDGRTTTKHYFSFLQSHGCSTVQYMSAAAKMEACQQQKQRRGAAAAAWRRRSPAPASRARAVIKLGGSPICISLYRRGRRTDGRVPPARPRPRPPPPHLLLPSATSCFAASVPSPSLPLCAAQLPPPRRL